MEIPGIPSLLCKVHGDKSDSAICLWHAMLSYLLWDLAAQDQIVQRVGVAGTEVMMYEYRIDADLRLDLVMYRDPLRTKNF